jgi:hypothetical protein
MSRIVFVLPLPLPQQAGRAHRANAITSGSTRRLGHGGPTRIVVAVRDGASIVGRDPRPGLTQLR